MSKKNRHIVAFVISSFAYGMFIFSFFYFYWNTKTNNLQNTQKNSFDVSIINNTNQQIKQQNVPKILTTNKFSSNQINKTQNLESLQKITNNSNIQTKQETKTIEQNPNPNLISHKIINEQATQKIETSQKRDNYFNQIKNTIEKHKYYPQNALKRGIESDMLVKFTISSAGELIFVEILSGNKIFQIPLIEAIKSTFPLMPPKNVLNENTTLTLMVSYKILD